jgi:hypothetical protein
MATTTCNVDITVWTVLQTASIYLPKILWNMLEWWRDLNVLGWMGMVGLRTVYRMYGLYGTRKRLRHPYRGHSVAAKPVTRRLGLTAPYCPSIYGRIYGCMYLSYSYYIVFYSKLVQTRSHHAMWQCKGAENASRLVTCMWHSIDLRVQRNAELKTTFNSSRCPSLSQSASCGSVAPCNKLRLQSSAKPGWAR